MSDQLELKRKFAAARPRAEEIALGPDKGFATRYRPRLAGRWVHNDDDPEDGFLTPEEAKASAARFRDLCRESLVRAAIPPAPLAVE